MIDDAAKRKKIAAVLGAVVDTIARIQRRRITQEPALTAKIGQALEDAAKRVRLPKSRFTITVQDIPDRGPGALEEVSGIDLYVNVTVDGSSVRMSKGFLVQAKMASGRKDIKLAGQCNKMLDRSASAYVWVYSSHGTSVANAGDVIINPDLPPERLSTRTPATLFDALLECSEGDSSIGLPIDLDPTTALEPMMRKLKAPRGASINFKSVD